MRLALFQNVRSGNEFERGKEKHNGNENCEADSKEPKAGNCKDTQQGAGAQGKANTQESECIEGHHELASFRQLGHKDSNEILFRGC